MMRNLRWLNRDGPHVLSDGVSFGMSWARGMHQSGQAFVIEADHGEWPVDSREIAYWADGSLKWTAHSISGDVPYRKEYTVKAGPTQRRAAGVRVLRDGTSISVISNQGLHLQFGQTGDSSILKRLDIDETTVCSGVTIIASINGTEHTTRINAVEIENQTFSRVVVKVSGAVVSGAVVSGAVVSGAVVSGAVVSGAVVSGAVEAAESYARLPFDVRFYVDSNSPSIKIIHSFVHNLDSKEPLTSLGLRFAVPLEQTELYNRHIRLGGSAGAILKEEVKGLSGLRHGPTDQNRIDQTKGSIVTLREEDWARTNLKEGLSYIPSWDSYSLTQLSSDGFTIKKRTKPGCSWVKVIGGGRADGNAYVGSAQNGGLAVGMSDFWERYPTQIDLDKLSTGTGIMTVWLYSPLAEPLETASYHDGLRLDSYKKQLEALDVTYEDFEPGFATANGIGRTNQFFLKPFQKTPSNEALSAFSALVRDPPRLVATGEHMYAAGVFHGCWSPNSLNEHFGQSVRANEIESNLELLFNFYKGQVEQNRWYGFWDHGDVQHTYDRYRHAWRYDVGGFAWDNSELSTDSWLWLYFLHTGRADVFKMAEAMTRHTGEVDVYHLGRFKGFGTRHGVQHFCDSSKQLRISNVLYRRIYFYITGDERVGDLITELQDCQKSLLVLDSHRKVQSHAEIPEGFAMMNIGLDGGPLAAAWLTAWERRSDGWETCKDLLINLLDGIADLKHGIGNNAILFNPSSGEVRECPRPTPEWAISHLSMLFGFPEIMAELFHYAQEEYPLVIQKFKKVYLAYCRAYNGGPKVQHDEFGFEFPSHATWRQSHSTLTAFAAANANPIDEDLAAAAWEQFFNTDGFAAKQDWRVLQTSPPEFFSHGEEAFWISTNEAARYGVSALVNLATLGQKFR